MQSGPYFPQASQYNPQQQQQQQQQQQSSYRQSPQNNWNQGYGQHQQSNQIPPTYGTPTAFGQASAPSNTPRYLAGYLTNNQGTPRGQSNAFNSPQRQSSNDDYGNQSFDRGSPPTTRGAIFGASVGKQTPRNTRQYQSTNADTEDMPPMSSMDDDDLFQQPQTFLPPPASPSRLNDDQPTPQQSQASLAVDAGPCKVVVFGFPLSSLASITDHFGNIGQITAVEPCLSPLGNWATISFAQSWCAARAVRRSGELINGIMVGVKWPDGVEVPSPRSQPAVPQHQQQQQQVVQSQSTPARGTLGTPVPILGSHADAYKQKAQTPAKWSMWAGSAPQNTAIVPAPVQQAMGGAAQSNNAQQPGMWSKVSDAIFGL